MFIYSHVTTSLHVLKPQAKYLNSTTSTNPPTLASYILLYIYIEGEGEKEEKNNREKKTEITWVSVDMFKLRTPDTIKI